ncbi:trinucleotide repeat-containing 6B protein isoform C [Patagioenas fasciata monilis]|uniref:Trinucleotide repeat-containing 6B protein isoform C n=1 Tax=Patagioenas fasciata monilis TaxID=372326 RepID=A0A1V4JB21_PATFA|nr:trinucleotide repeat-containing 6B protein isoform C [Patagioenas fasciata monilis]
MASRVGRPTPPLSNSSSRAVVFVKGGAEPGSFFAFVSWVRVSRAGGAAPGTEKKGAQRTAAAPQRVSPWKLSKAVFCISAELCTDTVPMQTDEGEILEEGSPKMEHEDFVMEGHGKTPPPGEENKQEKEQEREEQLMEDKKRKKEDKKKKESAQKVTDQKTKVPEVTKPSLSQPVAASPIGNSPSPPVNGGNNAKRVAVPNGQPPSAARYMPREVPPRFRCQQDHKVLLKRGQPPPPSCMLLGGGAGPPPPAAPGANTNNAQPVTGALLQTDSGTATDSAIGGAAASNYANSTWGPGASSNSGTNANPTHIWDKVIVDGSDMEEWPCIASKDAESSSENTTDNNSASNPGLEKNALPGSTTSNKGKGSQCQSGGTGNECNLGAWKSDPKAKSVQSSNPAAESNNGLARGSSGTDTVSGQSNSGNHGNNGKDREDSWKGASVQKPNGSRNDSWDNNNRSTGEMPRTEGKSDKGTEGWESSATQTKNSGGWGDVPSQSNQIKSGWGNKPVSGWGEGGQNEIGTWDEEPSGWEEPSPQSISRKMDIDDGTSAWGDPSSYNYKNVNLWDKNSQGGQAPREQSLPTPMTNKSQASVWSKSTPPAPDNGTSAWGEPNETSPGWGEVDDTGASTTGWGNAPSNAPNAMKSSSKSMQDGWGESDGPVTGTRHSSWEEEEEGGVWNTAGSQGSSSSHNSTSWGQGGKKTQMKCSLKGGNSDSWMNPLSKQFSNMGLLSQTEDIPGSKMDLSVGGLPDKKFEVDKRAMNLGDFNDMMRKDRSGFRPPNSKDMGTTDSGPYFEKGGNHGLFGNSTAQSRGMHTPVQPLNPSPNIRAQVPPQFLSPQVSASMLKQFPNSGLNPGLFNMGPQLSPQQIAMLSQLPQIPQFQLIARMVSALQQQQQRQPGMKHSPSHPVGPKPHLDSMVPNPLNVGLSDLQTKGQIPGYGSSFGSSGMDYGMVGGKEAGTESRFKQWTMMEGLPSVASQDANMHKNGAIVPPGKARGGSPYNQFDIIQGDPLGGHAGPAGDSWLPAKSPPTNKIGSKSSNASWPPEFQPGVPWKGIQNIDPESDPYVTPGSVLGGTATSPIVDTDHQLLRDNTTGSNSSLNTSLPSPGAWPYSASDNSFTNVHSTSAKFSDYKSTWSPDPIGHNPTHLSNKMWKNHISSRNTTGLPRPPPGLTNPKPSSPWNSTAPRSVRGWGAQDSRLASASTWSDGGSVRPSYWLVLHNLTPQIDGSTLRTICMQHGPLLTFHLNLTQGTALIRYNTKQEAAKAQTALHMCVLGNTTILAEFATDEEVSRFLAQAQPPTPAATPSAPTAGWQSLETGQNQTDPVGPALNLFACSKERYRTSGEKVEEMRQCLTDPGCTVVSIPHARRCLNSLRVFHGHRNSAL